ncbi:5-guanidino-2-oxopentanoate decarboxylase [Pseudomonas taiwanensis]|uniref:5-guanidino-2-oxopentanoate decarboxylase n=1 Tax=Pseudomonas taiwanensis TaxID=470150 RepID=UPI001644ED56|nr:5-guanidino-2-oxopentanoate decarboxylase [Pseudomonas taiwanensis]MBC3489434.1 5-guanidino-2-oxopentanoate decarboxylase [Pseudomonas taiwanensis]
MTTCAEYLVNQLQAWSVDTVFGIPGVHTIGLYRGLPKSSIRHVTPRHEQGIGFMADGYARVTGKPGVCFCITGPGMTNIATALGQAYADSIPILVISSVNERSRLGLGNGYLHELPSQRNLIAGVTAFSHTVLNLEQLPQVLLQAFSLFRSGRPQPVHIEIPLDLIELDASHLPILELPRQGRLAPDPELISAAAKLLLSAERPLLLVGGGCQASFEKVRLLAAALDAPTACTINAKGVLPNGHPLALGSNQSLDPVRRLAAQADVILAIGTELAETDYDVVFNGGFKLNGKIIRIDVDPTQLNRNYVPSIALPADAELAIDALLKHLPVRTLSHESVGAQRAAAVREEILQDLQGWADYTHLFDVINQALPDARYVGDSTQTVYSGNHLVELDGPRRWFNASTGYGTLGYALPAAIGAKIADPQSPVVCLIGDGGLQFTLGEMSSAIEANAPIIVLLWNNNGYGEIKTAMERRDVQPLGVDIYTPEFKAIAQGFGWKAVRASDHQDLSSLLVEAAQSRVPTLIEVCEAAPFATAQ